MKTFYIEQFGCRATQADGAALERQLLERGCALAQSASAAEIVVVNTCTVTASADAQARDAIRKLHAANPAVRLIVTGCYAQRAPEELAALPGVSWVVGNSHKPQIPLLIDSLSSVTPPNSANDFFPVAALHSDSTVPFHSFVGAELAPPNSPHLAKILTGNIFDRAEFLSAPSLAREGNHTRPTLKIQDGCDSRCSYCVIPFVRGKSRSLPPDKVIAEIRRLTVGQAFLPVRSESLRAPLSAREIVLSGINLGTYGRDLSPRVEFEDLLRRILGETPLERLRITYLHVFSFSKRPGTKAAALSNEVPGAIIKRRARELRALGESKAAAFRQSQISRTLRVLTLHPSSELTGRQTPALSSNYLPVFVAGVFPATQSLDVRLGSCRETYLVGQISESVSLQRQ